MSNAKVLPQYVAGLAAAGGSLACGSVIGWSSPVQDELQNSDSYGFKLSGDEFSWVGSLMTLGAATVCIPIGVLITWIGRKLTMLLMVIPFVIGWLIIIFAQNAIMMMIARFLLGMAGGAFCVAAPIYTTEIAQKEIRGIIGSFFQMLITCGILFSYLIGMLFKCFVFSIVCGIVPIVFAVIFVFMPESPYYLVAKDNMEGAQKSMKWLRGNEYDTSGELAEMKAINQKIKDNPVPWTKALCRRITLKSLGLSISLMIFQQFTGINAIIFYSTDVFESAGGSISSALCTTIVGIMLVSATLVSLFIIDRLGRIPLLMMSCVFQAISTLAMGIYFFMKDRDAKSVQSISWVPITAVCVFILMFSVGFGPVPWLFMAEIFSEDIKGIAGSISGCINWTCAFIVTKSFMGLRDTIGTGAAFWTYTIMSIIAGVFIFFLIPETKGISFSEIQNKLEGKKEAA